MSDYVYFVRSGDGGNIKIGFSGNPRARIAHLQKTNPEPLYCLGIIPGSVRLERQLHQKFAKCRTVGEWFQATPEIVEFAKSNCAPLETAEAGEDQLWLAEQALQYEANIGADLCGITPLAFKNIQNGKSFISFDSITSWLRSDKEFAKRFFLRVGLVIPSEAPELFDAFGAYHRLQAQRGGVE